MSTLEKHEWRKHGQHAVVVIGHCCLLFYLRGVALPTTFVFVVAARLALGNIATMNGPGAGSGRAGSSRSAAGSTQRGPSMAEGSSSSGSGTIPTLHTIDDVVSLIKAANTNVKEQRLLLPALQKLNRSNKGQGYTVLLDQLQGNIDPLSMLDPAHDTLGYLYILATRAAKVADADGAQQLLRTVETFALNLNPEQLQGTGEIVTVLARGIVHVATLINDHVWAMPSMLRVFDAFCRSNNGFNNLTTLHPILVYQGLKTAHYDVVHDWAVQHDIVAADVNVSPLMYTDVLEYFYYAGMVCTKIGNLQRACEMFEQCICTPSQAVSAIQVDAYKKLILVQLLKDGHTSPLPKFVSQAITRAIRGAVVGLDSYTSLARIIEGDASLATLSREPETLRAEGARTTDKLKQKVIGGQDQYAADSNLGLVKRLESTFTHRRVLRLASTFTHISIGTIVDILGIDAGSGVAVVVQELRHIDDGGELMVWITSAATTEPVRASLLDSAVIGSLTRDDVAAFVEAHLEQTGLPGAQRLMDTMKESQRWRALVQEKERAIAKSEAYLSKVYTSRGRFTAGMGLDDDDDAFA